MKLEFGPAAEKSKEMTLDDIAAAVEKARAMGADGGRAPKVKINLNGTIQRLNVEA